ncbi:septal ring lytic transglycosylase RlpA family protein [Legionella israelensis]|uniref:Endolytic peptidoglycan transglycosylase RlpA n=1 Tax=Legionella israelensis TaxID=454 RepID=A0A0W0VUC4_9GAMM|nr:septal ring lytic transglycosylase RlpA family protein [Legionella israelensis]KTD23650.1 rare lipoprotein A [Legionella israelensis]QBS08610.1 septal ring lytic transglycosylase RlpA family protein [Legionella israelensis]SCY38675.1 rare lipoprotein A [Legionella israelensis DSM 19235]STX58268.1 Lipoprotein [Legionella israelensis]
MRHLIFLFLLLLSSCNSHHPINNEKKIKPLTEKIEPASTLEEDGPPRAMKEASFIEAVPVSEPLSRYGNPQAYDVEGKTYNVLQTASGYKSRGIASWYGTKFHKKRTSSGEEYNMYAMTAAHKTLPLPTYVKVKNLKNGRVAIVKVNDRGPFRKDRIIDLSYAAAAKLGLLPEGTAPVEIETLKSAEKKALYYIQAGAFHSEKLAKSLQKKLALLISSPVFVAHFDTHFLVKAGPFKNISHIEEAQKVLDANGIKGSFATLN